MTWNKRESNDRRLSDWNAIPSSHVSGRWRFFTPDNSENFSGIKTRRMTFVVRNRCLTDTYTRKRHFNALRVPVTASQVLRTGHCLAWRRLLEYTTATEHNAHTIHQTTSPCNKMCKQVEKLTIFLKLPPPLQLTFKYASYMQCKWHCFMWYATKLAEPQTLRKDWCNSTTLHVCCRITWKKIVDNKST